MSGQVVPSGHVDSDSAARPAHLIGVFLWIGGLFATYWLLRIHAQAPKDVHEKLTLMERSLALVDGPRARRSRSSRASWMALTHDYDPSDRRTCSRRRTRAGSTRSSTLVLLGILPVHGIMRAQDRQVRPRSRSTGIPQWLWSLLLVAICRHRDPRVPPPVLDARRSCTSTSTRSSRRSSSGMIPTLRGKPVLVGGSVAPRRGRGVLVRGAQVRHPFARCRWPRRCGAARTRSSCATDMDRYAEASRALLPDPRRLLARRRRPLARRGVPRCHRQRAPARRRPDDRARRSSSACATELSLVASVGVAPIKLAAKIASDIDKPDGLRVVTPEDSCCRSCTRCR